MGAILKPRSVCSDFFLILELRSYSSPSYFILVNQSCEGSGSYDTKLQTKRPNNVSISCRPMKDDVGDVLRPGIFGTESGSAAPRGTMSRT